MKVSIETRKNIADAFIIHKINWSGRLIEADFLSRLFDLKDIRSNDPRHKTAYGDIMRHRGSFIDWENNWIFTDSRFDLLHVSDDIFLKFLCEILNPAVRPEQYDMSEPDETDEILKIFNYHLANDNLEIKPKKQSLGKPTFEVAKIEDFGESFSKKQDEIIDYLSSEYVRQQIAIMERGIEISPHDAIGKSKELVETIFKSILQENGIVGNPNWNLPRLAKETNKVLQFIPSDTNNSEQAENSIVMVLNGMATSIHGLTELRNNFGSGHGHEAGFQGLEKRHAKICVGFATELARFYLDILKNT